MSVLEVLSSAYSLYLIGRVADGIVYNRFIELGSSITGFFHLMDFCIARGHKWIV